MSEKINLQDLISLLAKKSGITKKEAEIFLREFFRTVDEGIFSDRLVKVKNLGTFKLVEVEDRESVNVISGERVLIPSHYKISYTPDTDLSQKINQPFALFESMDMPDETAEVTEENKPVRKIIIEKAPLPQKTLQDNVPPMSIDNFLGYEEGSKWQTTNSESGKKRRKKIRKLYIPWKLLACIAAVTGFIYFYRSIERAERQEVQTIMRSFSKPKKQSAKDSRTLRVQPRISFRNPKDTLPANENMLLVRPDTLKKKVEEKTNILLVEPPKEQPQPAAPKATTTTVKKRTIRSGEMLTVIALNEYGHKAFWIYLYLENKNIIHNPNNVPAGTQIIIPPASKYGIDPDNPASVKKATELMRKTNN